jgi:thiamine kinase-like enzyme
MNDAIARARAALAAIPTLADRAEGSCITRLGGLTNLVFRVESPAGNVCLRLPGAGTADYIDRASEARNARAAAAAGVSPEVLHFGEDGVMVTALLDAETMSPERFRTRVGAVEHAGQALRQLHDLAQPFPARFEFLAMIEDYVRLLARLGVADLPEGCREAVRGARDVQAALSTHPLPSASCHCDPLCENFLDAGERMWIVDWEYAGVNDPMWDLGDFSVEGGFDADTDDRLLRAYFGRPPEPGEHGRMVAYKAMSDLFWAVWGFIQHANRNPVDDFWAYGLGRLRRCEHLMAQPLFAESLDAVRRG